MIHSRATSSLRKFMLSMYVPAANLNLLRPRKDWFAAECKKAVHEKNEAGDGSKNTRCSSCKEPYRDEGRSVNPDVRKVPPHM